MNKQFIHDELNRRGIIHEFENVDAGPAVEFLNFEGHWFGALLPVDDASDAAFCDFIDATSMKPYAQLVVELDRRSA